MGKQQDRTVSITIKAPESSIDWVIGHLNNFCADNQQSNPEHLHAHRFVSALSLASQKPADDR